MATPYHIDLAQFTLERFQSVLQTGRLLPSEQILRKALAERFAILASMGVHTLADLTAALSTKKRREQFAEQSGLPLAYLTVLRRRAGSYTPRPIPLRKLPGIEARHIERLAGAGIVDTQQLFDAGRTPQERAALCERAGVPGDALLELIQLSDLARPPYVGPAFARLLYETGVDTIAKLAEASPEELRQALVEAKERTGVYRAAIPGLEDLASWLSKVRELPQAIEW